MRSTHSYLQPSGASAVSRVTPCFQLRDLLEKVHGQRVNREKHSQVSPAQRGVGCESRDPCFQLRDLLGKVHGQRVNREKHSQVSPAQRGVGCESRDPLLPTP